MTSVRSAAVRRVGSVGVRAGVDGRSRRREVLASSSSREEDEDGEDDDGDQDQARDGDADGEVALREADGRGVVDLRWLERNDHIQHFCHLCRKNASGKKLWLGNFFSTFNPYSE